MGKWLDLKLVFLWGLHCTSVNVKLILNASEQTGQYDQKIEVGSGNGWPK